ncbi:E2/E3 hybrid ubiquitin-protein ligase ube2o [Saguinus oedipus]|uniref:E2/E3 hybrid ubiquitin-protein ligase ube2o n=1 Tax=Saguinus oedipus TaxID=9490 RepID=A0ABQ9VRW2_SAGOE|nr:E2/E3 hybrid ubiquitin-protein ligase ube2o [Saguinus oedipus]
MKDSQVLVQLARLQEPAVLRVTQQPIGLRSAADKVQATAEPILSHWYFLLQLKLEDRSVVPRDVVRHMRSTDSQCGTVIDVNIDCAVKLIGTNCIIYPVNSKDLQHIWVSQPCLLIVLSGPSGSLGHDLRTVAFSALLPSTTFLGQKAEHSNRLAPVALFSLLSSKPFRHEPFMYGDYIAYDCWLGKVYDLKNQIILKLSNGARCSMNTEDGAKLYDVCPHVSDSVGNRQAQVWRARSPKEALLTGTFLWPQIPQGLFFDDSYGFYPGQVLIGPAKIFSSVQWLSGVKPVLSTKSKFRVVVEEVQVVELKVTWITKSFCPGGTDSVSPPPSVITQENLGSNPGAPMGQGSGPWPKIPGEAGEHCWPPKSSAWLTPTSPSTRVKRLGCFDHAQRQLGERCLYVFPAKVEPAKIAWECPEKNCAQGEGSMAKKVKRLLKKQVVRIMSCSPDTQCSRDHSMEDPDKKGEAKARSEADSASPEETPDGSASPVEMQDEGVEEPQEAGDQLPPFLLKEGRDDRLHSAEQDADDEAADDTDDTSSVTSSASSTTSSQSGSGTSRKKSIPLSIKNLKRKHKRKKNKITRDFKPGDRVAVEVVTTMTSADVMWQDGSVECNIRSNDLFPVHHLDNNEFCPGDFVVDKRGSASSGRAASGVVANEGPVQSCPDPAVYGVVQSGDHIGRTCMVKWFKLRPSGDDVELIGEEEDVSVYDIADHPDFRFRTTDIVIRIGNTEDGAPHKEDEVDLQIQVLVRCSLPCAAAAVPDAATRRAAVPKVKLLLSPSSCRRTCFPASLLVSGFLSRCWLRLPEELSSLSQAGAQEGWGAGAGAGPPDSAPFAQQPSVGQVARVDVSSKVEVVWADNSKTIILPQHLYNIESEIEESDYDSVEGSTSGASSDEWEDDSDSWETDNGLVEDEHPKIEEPPIPPMEQPVAPEEDKGVVISEEAATAAVQGAVAMAAPMAGLMEKAGKDGPPKSFRELKEAIKILESLKNMTVEQLLTGSPTSPTVEPEKPTREKKFLDDIKKLQENLKKTLDNVAIAEEEKMEAVPDVERKEDKPEGQSPVKAEWPSETPVLCQQCGGKPGVTFTSAKGEVFSVLEFAPCESAFAQSSPFPIFSGLLFVSPGLGSLVRWLVLTGPQLLAQGKQFPCVVTVLRPAKASGKSVGVLTCPARFADGELQGVSMSD